MSDIWIVDATPIIVLAKVSHLHLLTDLTSEVLIPSRVAREVLKGPSSDPARQALQNGWGTRMPARYIPSAIRSLGVLDAGEQAVLALALKYDGCTVVLDDAKGRAGADALDIPKIGTLGVVLRAHKQGHITMMAPVVRALMGVGLYLDQTVIQKVLASVGEKWP